MVPQKGPVWKQGGSPTPTRRFCIGHVAEELQGRPRYARAENDADHFSFVVQRGQRGGSRPSVIAPK
jgi:hypothetical protein